MKILSIVDIEEHNTISKNLQTHPPVSMLPPPPTILPSASFPVFRKPGRIVHHISAVLRLSEDDHKPNYCLIWPRHDHTMETTDHQWYIKAATIPSPAQPSPAQPSNECPVSRTRMEIWRLNPLKQLPVQDTHRRAGLGWAGGSGG